MMKKMFVMALLALLLAGFGYVLPGASTVHASSLQRPAFDDCVAVTERDGGWGVTGNSQGYQLNLNGVYFGVQNNCDRDAVRGSWSISVYGECPKGTVGGGSTTAASGTLGLLPENDFDKLFAGTLFFKCVDPNNQSSAVPSYVSVGFSILATLSGGRSSLSTTISRYPAKYY